MQYLDAKNLPEPLFFASGFETILAELVAEYEKAMTELSGEAFSLEETNPDKAILRVFAYRENLFRINANEAAKKNLLMYADGAKLDHLGAFYGVQRLKAAQAVCDILFTFQNPLQVPLLIARAGIKSGDNKLVFHTESKTVPAGSSEATLHAVCDTAGEVGNGYTPGTITALLSPLPYVEKAANSTTSTGGADTETDDHFRERIFLKPDSISTTGSETGYIFWTKSAHQDITDVALDSPTPGLVRIFPLMKDGLLPDSTILSTIKQTLEQEKIKTFTDTIEVLSPEAVACDITVSLIIYKSYIALTSTILEEAYARTNNWREAQKQLGKDIVPEQLLKSLQDIPGMYRVLIEKPVYTILEPRQVALPGPPSITIKEAVDA